MCCELEIVAKTPTTPRRQIQALSRTWTRPLSTHTLKTNKGVRVHNTNNSAKAVVECMCEIKGNMVVVGINKWKLSFFGSENLDHGNRWAGPH